MIPILLSGETVKGFLADAMTCVVTEERNGIYELTLTYPVTGALFAELSVDRFVKAKPNDTSELQLFRIYEITKPLNGVVTVNGEHVSYALSHYPANNISVMGKAVEQVYQELSGTEKLEKAKENIVEILNNKDIAISEIEIDMLIEACVTEFNLAFLQKAREERLEEKKNGSVSET